MFFKLLLPKVVIATLMGGGLAIVVGGPWVLPFFLAEGEAVAAYDQGDYGRAIKLYRLAADLGDASAQNTLGGFYARGEGVPQDYVEAAKWYRLAAEWGDATAQNNLGLMYLRGEGVFLQGEGVPQDYVEAARWLWLAAEQGNASAQNNLGLMYLQGKGVPQDVVLAHFWSNLAAAQGEEEAKHRRDLAAHHMTPDQLAKSQRLAREWKPVAER